jgi:hypothetical protein
MPTTSHCKSCWGTNLFIASHTAHTSPTSAIHVGDSSPTSANHVGYFLLDYANHAGSMSPTTASHARGIHMIEKPRRVRHNPKFLCRTCEGDHLTHLCPTTAVVQEAWSFPRGPSGSESSLPNLLQLIQESCQCNLQLTPLFI